MRKFNLFSFFLSLCIVTGCISKLAQNNSTQLHMNQMQVVGSHNSYKQKIQPEVMELIKKEGPDWAISLDYHHISLTDQLDMGLRNLELDVVYDPQGGRFANPLANKTLKDNGIKALPYDTLSEMNQPGFKVMHIPDLDFRTWHYTLKSALQTLRKWSDTHPGHLPVIITMNAKSENINKQGFTPLLPFTKAAFDSLDIEILTWLTSEKIITPDKVRGKYQTLNKAVLDNQWPLLKSARGHFLFVLDEKGEKQEIYLNGHPSLKERVMFVNAQPYTPASAFVIVNDPVAFGDSIKQLVKAGYMVRTRADADTKEARKNDYRRLEAAVASGAQVITTDYYIPDTTFRSGYHVNLPGNIMERVNPLFKTVAP